MSNILEINDVTVMYGKSVAIHDISLKVPEGKIVTMVGANGAGKSTTLKALAGIVPVTKGSIRFQGEELVGQPTQEIVRKGLVLVPEGRHLFPYLSCIKSQLKRLRTDREGIQEDLEYIYQLFPKLKDRRIKPEHCPAASSRWWLLQEA